MKIAIGTKSPPKVLAIEEAIKNCLYFKGEELGPVLSEITGTKGASQKTGAFGHWSDDILTRKDQFKLAFLSTIPNFYNKYYKI